MKLKMLKIILQITVLLAIIQQSSQILNKKSQLNQLIQLNKHLKTAEPSNKDDSKPQPLPSELPDFDFDGKSEYKEFENLLKNHHLTKGEIKVLFRLADLNKNSKLDNEEWFHFQKIFVQPFETCDSDKDYYLNKDELGKCLEGDSLNGTKLTSDQSEDVMNYLDRGKAQKINFADYIFLRKVNLAWKECASDEGLSKLKMACAIEIAAPGRTLDLPEGKQVFDLALIFRTGQDSSQVSFLKFTEYLNIAHIFYYFTEFEIPFQDGKIYKREVIKALDNQLLPTTLNPEIVNHMYDGFEFLSFSGWAAMTYSYKLFSRFTKDTQNYLTSAEFNQLLQWKGFNSKLLKKIDSFKIPTALEIEEASSARGKRVFTEKDYLINFLQIKQQQNKKGEVDTESNVQTESPTIKGQEDTSDAFKMSNRNIIFKILNIKRDDKLKFQNFVQLLKFGWQFCMYDQDDNNFLDENELMTGPKKFESILPLRQNELVLMNRLQDFIGNYRGYIIDLKEFYAWFTFEQYLETICIKGQNQMVTKSRLINGFTTLGFRLAKYTISQSQQGQDPQLKQMIFNAKYAFQFALSDEIVANKKIFNTKKISEKVF